MECPPTERPEQLRIKGGLLSKVALSSQTGGSGFSSFVGVAGKDLSGSGAPLDVLIGGNKEVSKARDTLLPGSIFSNCAGKTAFLLVLAEDIRKVKKVEHVPNGTNPSGAGLNGG